MYFHLELDKKNYFGTPVTLRSFADEIDLYFDWVLNDNLTIGGSAGIAMPNSAAKQIVQIGLVIPMKS